MVWRWLVWWVGACGGIPNTFGIEFMSKKLFTRLELSLPHAESEQAVAALLEGVFSGCASRLQERTIAKLSQQMLSREVMYREVNSIRQAFPSGPPEQPLCEDPAQARQLREGSRPFSAKIEHVVKPGRPSSKKSTYQKRGSARSSYKYSMCQSASGKSREPRKYGGFRPNNDRFFPLQPEAGSLEDSMEEAFIDSLRERKAQEMAYQRSKDNFLKASQEEQERYPKLNKKFLQTIGSKPYYYNKNGETVELAASHHRLHKKTVPHNASARQEPSNSRRSNEVRSQVTVEYQEKENYFKRTREAFQIEARPAVLFYKSEQCKYQIVA